MKETEPQRYSESESLALVNCDFSLFAKCFGWLEKWVVWLFILPCCCYNFCAHFQYIDTYIQLTHTRTNTHTQPGKIEPIRTHRIQHTYKIYTVFRVVFFFFFFFSFASLHSSACFVPSIRYRIERSVLLLTFICFCVCLTLHFLLLFEALRIDLWLF